MKPLRLTVKSAEPKAKGIFVLILIFGLAELEAILNPIKLNRLPSPKLASPFTAKVV